MAISKKRDTSDSRIASLRLQDKEYNEMYRKWRIEHKKDYGFYFLDNSDELTYRDGEGFITESPQAAERAAFSEIHSLLARFLCIYSLLNFLVMAAGLVMTSPEFDIPLFRSINALSFGNEFASVAVDYLVRISVRILPLFYLMKKINMPKKIFMPTKIYNKPLFFIAVPMAMLTFGVATVLSNIQHTSAALMGVDPTFSITIPRNRLCLVLSAVLTVVIVPVISEVVHHGIILQILKQFGDGYALIVTSIIAALTSCNFHIFLFTFTIMLITGFFVVRSGSILTGFIMRIVISGSVYFLTFLKTVGLPEGVYMTITSALLFVYISAGFAAVSVFIKKHSNKINLPLYKMYLDNHERIMCCLTNASVIIWLSLAFMLMIINIRWR
ncbi:MAG: hypothetical protein MSJ26_02445 [Oscillospiraceae bacterium]|nr:hypothetical protein [Oscillospiraceae bacterium]